MGWGINDFLSRLVMKWKPIKYYEGLYLISDKGKVYSIKSQKVLAKRYNTMGYLHVALYRNGERQDRLVHRLVANHFLDRVPGKTVVNHKNGRKLDNSKDNLEWATPQENTQHYYDYIRKAA